MVIEWLIALGVLERVFLERSPERESFILILFFVRMNKVLPSLSQ